MKFWKCAVYLMGVGIVAFFAGRFMPKGWIKPDRGLFRSFVFEKNGAAYEKLGIRKWQNKALDMSRILPFAMPPKNLSGNYEERLPVMIRETCVAELVHIAESVVGLRCLWIWPGAGGVTVTAIYILVLNLPFILIQRYNRPRLLRLQQKLLVRKKKKEGIVCES